MHLQKAVDYDVFARSLSIGAETMVMKFQPDQPMHLRYAVDHSFLSPAGGRRGRDDRQAGERLLPVGVQLVRDAGQRRRGLPDRLRQRLPGRGADEPALLLPVGDQGAGQVVCLRAGHRQAAAAGPDHRRSTSRSPTQPGRRMRTSSRRTARLPTATSTPSATTISARAASATSTPSSWTGSPARTSTSCSSTPCARCTRRTSTSSSSRTCAACSACGSGTRAAVAASA